MKNLKILACLLAFAAAGVAYASEYSLCSLGFGVQYWDAKDADVFDKDGLWGGNVILRIQPAEYLGIDIRGGCSGIWDSKTYRVDGTKYETDASFTCCPLEAGLLLMLPLADGFTIYGGPGIGYYFYDIDVETSKKHHHHFHSERSEHIELDDDFGWYAVAGLNIQLANHFSIFGEARYTDTDTSLEDDDSEKIDCSGVAFQVGVMINF